MPILLAGTIEIVHIEQVSALFTFRLGQVLLYIYFCLSLIDLILVFIRTLTLDTALSSSVVSISSFSTRIVL
jgi:hypothetical protein